MSDVIKSDDEHCDLRWRFLFPILSEVNKGLNNLWDICYHLIDGLLDMTSFRTQCKLFLFLIESSILSHHQPLTSFQQTALDRSSYCTKVPRHSQYQWNWTWASTRPCRWRPVHQKFLDKDAFDRHWWAKEVEHPHQHRQPQRTKSEASQYSFSLGLTFDWQ